MGIRRMLATVRDAAMALGPSPSPTTYAALPQHSPRATPLGFRDAEKHGAAAAERAAGGCWVNARTISDVTIGLSDGLTVPFALTAGLAALGDTRLVIYGGMAELLAGAISMGVGGYLGARSECEAYHAALADATRSIEEDDAGVDRKVRAALAGFGLSDLTLDSVVTELRQSPEATESFLMRFHHEQPESAGSAARPYLSGLTIALGYLFGGLLPLIPYLVSARMETAFWWSCVVMVNVLFSFGCGKTWFIDNKSGTKCLWSGVQMVILGGLAATAAMTCVTAIGNT